ncbi:MAG: hypothetical protein KZQ60_07975, partial [Candidatus Thiodiazotropha sp. (ex Lucinoma aequizonata)]|nr:hypothetical protein [Candidatus Thiodiazotropha sp. (ex Lucinoma aequizonata)]MCU7886845.1 hypothetical protein [Candidatus Thiodiazotropha sp. (ex Lucinoma aequizonata)]MCU7897704.1 hypothetical protein [Candidatus Thiodiazotropha sp. (ex Lucinoma aequizonata)]MCU7912893.1 hypothetical protein [Candidatus Thiodiazotropha sp. (ex Lucinoma aequizonata)]
PFRSPFRPYNRAYAYRGLTAFAPLSIAVSACDHDFAPETTVTPFGILLPKTGDNHLWFSQSKVTADFMVNRLEEMMPQWKKRFALHTLVINADNGPESSGRRT